jgi:hypothetical protein
MKADTLFVSLRLSVQDIATAVPQKTLASEQPLLLQLSSEFGTE